jgi:hypothetical protein
MTAHKKIARRHPVRVIYDMVPSYIRAVHDTNDSRALHSPDTVNPDLMPDILKAFPLLAELIDRPGDQKTESAEAA